LGLKQSVTIEFWTAVNWNTQMLEKFTLDMLLEVVGEVITEPEILFPVIACVLLLWALIAIAKLWIAVIETVFSRNSGPRGLGLN